MGDTAAAHDLDVLEIVFSCGVCQATVSEVYASRESNKGFHSSSGDDDGVVTRMWIADCTHLFCGKHLPSGAAPFHRQDAQPEVACPQCVLDVHDDSPRKLYGIRGFNVGEHDPMIPSNWFKCPPAEIEASSIGMEAVRFQYVALARFAQKIHARYKAVEHMQAMTEAAHAGEIDQRKHVEAELQRLKREVAGIEANHEKDLVQLRKWQKREAVINHYLGIVPQMAEDLAQMRAQLADLGYLVPARDYQYRDNVPDHGGKENHATTHEVVADGGRFPSSSTTAVGDPLPSSYVVHEKATRTHHLNTQSERPLNGPGKQRTSSRDLMPPPFSKPPRRSDLRQNLRESAPNHVRPPQTRPSISSATPRLLPELSARQVLAPRAHALPPMHRQYEAVRPSSYALEQPYTAQMQVIDSQLEDSMRIMPDEVPSRSWGPSDGQAHRYEGSGELVRLHDARQSRVRHYDSVYGTAAAQLDTQAGEPMQLYSNKMPYTRPPTISPDVRATSQRQHQPLHSSVISPFFNRRGEPSSAARVGTQAPSQHSVISSRQPIYHNPPQFDLDWHNDQQGRESRHARPSVAMSQASDPRSMGDLQSVPQQEPWTTTESWRPPRSQFGDSQTVSQRSRTTNTHHGPTGSRSRITLPPPSSQISDVGLSQTRGVRGTFAPPQRYDQPHSRPGFQSSRGLFTANGRRSVRR